MIAFQHVSKFYEVGPVKVPALSDVSLQIDKGEFIVLTGPSGAGKTTLLNYLIGLVHDSRQQGWIKVDGVAQSLLAKLRTAKRKLEASDDPTAKKLLEAFVHEVRAVSCSDFACPGSKPLTSEAYALLFFNGQYLLDRLP